MLMRPQPAYRTFWRRVVAGLLDALILTPLFVSEAVIYSATGGSAAFAITSLGGSAVFFAYSIILHAKYGQTLGKRITGVRVLDVSGRSITGRQAILRDVPNIALTLVSFVLHVPLLLGGGVPFEGDSTTVTERVDIALTFAWMVLEAGTMLTNPKRRAIHDYLAGTIVVRLDCWQTAPLAADRV